MTKWGTKKAACGQALSKKPQQHKLFCRVVYRVGIFPSVSVGISRYLPYRYRRKTRSVFLVSKNWREPLKKLAGAPFFPRRGGLGPLFVHFALLLKKKKEFPRNYSKKEFPQNLKKGVPAKAYSTTIPTENTDTGCI
jgi:hypothetical protein